LDLRRDSALANRGGTLRAAGIFSSSRMSTHRLLEYRPNRWAWVNAETGAFEALAPPEEVQAWLGERQSSGEARARTRRRGLLQQGNRTAEAEDAASEAIAAGGIELVCPLGGRYPITSDFQAHKDRDPPSSMPGLDFGCPVGTEVRAWAGGRVHRSRWSAGGGRSLWIQHAQGIRTYYAHLRCAYVLEGETVSAGQKIGESGSTGRATGPHLHFSVVWQGDPVDPERFLPQEDAALV
jgi:murein DD-endopeptidase MepM/ murein hydrolase activator NlpD